MHRALGDCAYDCSLIFNALEERGILSGIKNQTDAST